MLAVKTIMHVSSKRRKSQGKNSALLAGQQINPKLFFSVNLLHNYSINVKVSLGIKQICSPLTHKLQFAHCDVKSLHTGH